jgi:hypothetical protein
VDTQERQPFAAGTFAASVFEQLTDYNGAEFDFSQPGANTELSYLYRDASNNKVTGAVIFPGRISKDEAQALMARLDAAVAGTPTYFIPGQVDIPDLQHLIGDGKSPWIAELDHPWHELNGVTYTDAAPTQKASVDELVRAFQNVIWDEEFRPAQYQEMIRRDFDGVEDSVRADAASADSASSVEGGDKIYNHHTVVARGDDEAIRTAQALTAAGLTVDGAYLNIHTDGSPYHVFAGHWIDESETQADRENVGAMFRGRYTGNHPMTADQYNYSESGHAAQRTVRFAPQIAERMKEAIDETRALRTSDDQSSPARTAESAALPVLDLAQTALVNDRREKPFAVNVTIEIVGQTRDGSVLGIGPAQVYSVVSRSAFESEPRVGERFDVSRHSEAHDVAKQIDRGQELARGLFER